MESMHYRGFLGQAGGHQKLKGVRCMLTDENGNILKYVEDSKNGKTEALFYKTVFSQPHFNDFHQFLPKFTGEQVIHEKTTKHTYLQLENMVKGFEHANVLDIKIGRITCDPFATPEKIEKEQLKSVGDLGFRISGIKIFNEKTKSFNSISGKMFRKCSCYKSEEEKVRAYLKMFLGFADERSRILYDSMHPACAYCEEQHRLVVDVILRETLQYLKKLLTYMSSEKRINLYASSVLIAYDATKFYHLSRCALHNNSPSSLWLLSYFCAKLFGNKKMLTHTCCDHKTSISCSGKPPSFPVERFTSAVNADDVRKIISIRNIDFGHGFIDLKPDSLDENFIYGLQGLTKIFNEFL